MRKDTFYRCVMKDKKVVAEETTGYSEGDIGIHKDEGFWIATHIPTGLLLTPKTSQNKTIKQALSEALHRIEKHENFPELLKQVTESEHYRTFSDSKYAQTATGVF